MEEKQEFIQLLKQAHDGDKEARDRLVTDNVGLVWSIVRHFNGRGDPGGSVPDRVHRPDQSH